MFFWLCDIQGDDLIFFDWYASPRKASPNDFWRMSTKWFDEKVNERTKLFKTAKAAGEYVDKHFGPDKVRMSFKSVQIVEVE